MTGADVNYADRAREIIDIELNGLRRLRDELDGAFNDVVEMLLECLASGHKLVVTGVGKNLPIGQKIASTLTSTGAPTVVLHPQEALHGDLGLISDGDAVLCLSYSGETEELLNLLPSLKRDGALKLIAVTGQTDSRLARYCDLVLPVQIDREACPFNMAPTTSTTATLAMGDALAMVLLEARGFQREDYARLHPGGAIGQSLLVRAGDIMRSGDRLPLVSETSTLSEALLIMTGARAGSLAVVNAEQQLLGIFTDGDLRRYVASGRSLEGVNVAELMTVNPITLSPDALAVDALRVFEEHSIDDLIVVDEEQHVLGLIDIQDLPKMKIL